MRAGGYRSLPPHEARFSVSGQLVRRYLKPEGISSSLLVSEVRVFFSASVIPKKHPCG